MFISWHEDWKAEKVMNVCLTDMLLSKLKKKKKEKATKPLKPHAYILNECPPFPLKQRIKAEAD